MPFVKFLFLFLFSTPPFIHCQELRYALFTSGPTGSFDSSGAVPAIELAEEMINADSSILPGYNLTHTPVVDTVCDRTLSLNEYFAATSSSQPTILGLLGCGCTAASEPVAEIIHYNSLSQISYASSWRSLNERNRFPNVFSTFPSKFDFTQALVTLVHHFDWKRIVIITETESLFTELGTLAVTTFSDLNSFEVASRMDSDIDLLNALNDPDVDFFFKNDDYRVFFVNTSPRIARQILCKAYKKGFVYPRYAWITHGRYDTEWWAEDLSTDCPDDELADILHRTLALTKRFNCKFTTPLTYSKLSIDELKFMYAQRLEVAAENFNYTAEFLIPGVAFDAMWTFAVALNRTSEMVASMTREEVLNMTQCEGVNEEAGIEWPLVSLENFTYSNQFMGCVIRWNLERTDFVGISGQISFDRTGSLEHSRLQVFQYQMDEDDERILIAYIEHVNESHFDFVYLNNETSQTVFPSSEGGVPPDGTTLTVRVTYHLALVVTFYILAAAGIAFTTVCLVFNYTQRNKRVVRLNSLNLNYLVIIGSYIMCISIFFRIMPSTDITVNAARCNLATLLNTIGYCLSYGGVLAKMGRIRYVLHNHTTSRKNLKDWHLLVIALMITGIGTSLAVLQVSVPLFQPQPYEAPNEEPPSTPMNEFGLKIEEVVLFCYNPARTAANIWIILTCGYLALLQIAGIILAIRLQKVNLKALENSRFVVAAIYISAISLMLVMVSIFAINNLPNVVEFLFSGSVMASTAVFISMIFIPKMVSVYKDPQGKDVYNGTKNFTENIDSTTIRTNVTAISSENSAKISQLESKIVSLKKAIRQYEVGEDSQSSSLPSSGGCSVSSSRKGSDIPLVRIVPLDRHGRPRITIDEAAASPPKSKEF